MAWRLLNCPSCLVRGVAFAASCCNSATGSRTREKAARQLNGGMAPIPAVPAQQRTPTRWCRSSLGARGLCGPSSGISGGLVRDEDAREAEKENRHAHAIFSSPAVPARRGLPASGLGHSWVFGNRTGQRRLRRMSEIYNPEQDPTQSQLATPLRMRSRAGVLRSALFVRILPVPRRTLCTWCPSLP